MPAQYIAVGDQNNVLAINTSLIALVKKEKPKLYVSYCPALDLYSQGATEKEAGENIIEATQLFIETCVEDNTLEKVLHDCGFKPVARSAAGRQSARKMKLPAAFAGAKQVTIPATVPIAAYG